MLVGAGGLWRAQVNLGEIIAGDGHGSQSTTCFRIQEKLKGGLPPVDRHQERLADSALGPIGYARANRQSTA